MKESNKIKMKIEKGIGITGWGLSSQYFYSFPLNFHNQFFYFL